MRRNQSSGAPELRAKLARGSAGFGAGPNKQIFAENRNCGHSCPACHLAEPLKWCKKNRGSLIVNLRFSGFFQPLCCGFHNNELFLVHGV